MTTVPNRPRRAVQPFATFDLSELEPQDAAPRTTSAEIAANLGLALVAIVTCYLVVVGAMATAVSQGWSA